MKRLTLIFLLLLALANVAAADPTDSLRTRTGLAVLRKLPLKDIDEIVWLARCMVSESDRLDEQRLVAWVVRNRVETGYRGRTYREVVLEDRQFSAFNTPSPRREYLLKLDQHTSLPSWRRTLDLATEVYLADPSDRPFSESTRHFYSPISMDGHATPDWARGETPIDLSTFGIDPFRFRFFANVDSSSAGVRTGPAEIEPAVEPGMGRLHAPRLRLSGKVTRPQRPSVERPARTPRTPDRTPGTIGQ